MSGVAAIGETHELQGFALAGAVVIGLGQVGELSPGQLEVGVRSALLDYVTTGR